MLLRWANPEYLGNLKLPLPFSCRVVFSLSFLRRTRSQGKNGAVKIWDLQHLDAPTLQFDTQSFSFCKCIPLNFDALAPPDSLMATPCALGPSVTVWDLRSCSVAFTVNCEEAGLRTTFGMVMAVRPLPALPNADISALPMCAHSESKEEASRVDGDSRAQCAEYGRAELKVGEHEESVECSAACGERSGETRCAGSDPVITCGGEGGHLGLWSVRAGKRISILSLHNEPGTVVPHIFRFFHGRWGVLISRHCSVLSFDWSFRPGGTLRGVCCSANNRLHVFQVERAVDGVAFSQSFFFSFGTIWLFTPL